jgi:hypothetical protein
MLRSMGVRPRGFTVTEIRRLMRDALSVVDDPDPNQDPHAVLCLVILQLLESPLT